jgi:glutamine amidotransferase
VSRDVDVSGTTAGSGDRRTTATPLIGIVDYGMGNRRSVQKAFEHVGARVALTADPQLLDAADGLVVPGVGAFPKAMRNLRQLGLAEVIVDRSSAGIPLLGICLGMQLLFERSEELEPTEGLGLIEGEVGWLQTDGLRVPHIGWSEVTFEAPSPLIARLPERSCPFYHVHSLAGRSRHAANVVGSAQYGERFATIVQRDLVFGVQFHPEKSSGHGLRMLENFVQACAEQAVARKSVAASA